MGEADRYYAALRIGSLPRALGKKGKYDMSLLREIQNSAIDSSTDISTLLRKCKVLAARLGNEEFKNWVDFELNGYPDIESLPDYRVLKVNSKGHFSGPFQSELRNADIPLMCIPEKFRDVMSHSYMTQPAIAIEALAKESNGAGLAQEPWNPNFVALHADKIYEGRNCLQAWKVISATSFVAAVDAVRNKILSFAIEIEAENPDAGEAPINTTPLPKDKVNHIFNTYITGNVQNLANASHNVEQKAKINEVSPEVFKQLIDAITDCKNVEGKKEISDSAQEMAEAWVSGGLKQKYNNFMSVLSDHMQVWGPVVGPYLPALAAVIP